MQYYIKCSRFAFGSWTVFKVARVSWWSFNGYMLTSKEWGFRSFLTLLDHHLATGFPEGDVSTTVSDAWSGSLLRSPRET